MKRIRLLIKVAEHFDLSIFRALYRGHFAANFILFSLLF